MLTISCDLILRGRNLLLICMLLLWIGEQVIVRRRGGHFISRWDPALKYSVSLYKLIHILCEIKKYLVFGVYFSPSEKEDEAGIRWCAPDNNKTNIVKWRKYWCAIGLTLHIVHYSVLRSPLIVFCLLNVLVAIYPSLCQSPKKQKTSYGG